MPGTPTPDCTAMATTRLQADGSIAYGYNLNDQEATESELQQMGIQAIPPCYANLSSMLDAHTNEAAQRRLANSMGSTPADHKLEPKLALYR